MDIVEGEIIEQEKTSATPKFTTLGSLRDVGDGGVEQSVIDNWIKDFQELSGKEKEDFNLTPLQILVANHSESFSKREADQVMRGPNLMITGPTSAGKTLCAEMLIANHLARGAHPIGCIYAVPLRALATEKWERFKKIFGSTQVYVSSSDYQEFDPLILNRRFRVVVVVYEKLYSWLTHSDTAGRILRKTALFVFDELQMLSDPQRGAKLELILTFIRDRQKRFSKSEDPRYHSSRIVGLGPAGDALREVASWLDATRIDIPDTERPVPLVEGYVNLKGDIYSEPLPTKLSTLYPDGKTLLSEVIGATRDEMIGASRDELTEKFVVKALMKSNGIGEGKRILVYCATKTGAEVMAKKLASALTRTFGKRQKLDEAMKNNIDNLEGTDTRIILKETIESGVGFHHGDLTLEERSLVEKLFIGRHGTSKLDVVVCTPTLAMGVNLPADYMLFSTTDTFRQTEYQSSGVIAEPLTALEYKQFAGRAGRYRPDPPAHHHGVALFLTDKDEGEAQKDIVEGLIRHKIDPIEPALHRWPYGLVPLALGVLAWQDSYFKKDFSSEAVKAIFANTLASRGRVFTQYKKGRYPIEEAAVKELLDISGPHDELVSKTPTTEFSLAAPGKVVAEQGIDIKTFEILKSIAYRLPEILQHPFVLLEELVQATEVVRLYPTSIPEGFEAARLTRKLRSFFLKQKGEGRELGPIANELLSAKYVPSDAHLTYLIRTVAAWLWMRGEKAGTITKSPYLPGIRHGAVMTLTDQLSWFMGALDPLWSALEFRPAIEKVSEEDEEKWWEGDVKQYQWDIKRFELRLRYGVHEGLESVARLRVREWHRERLVDLWDQVGGWDHPVRLLDYPLRNIEQDLRPNFLQLKKRIRSRNWIDDPRDVLDKQVSLVRQAIDTFSKYVTDDESKVDWDVIIQDLYFNRGSELVTTVCEVLKRKPLKLDFTLGQHPYPDIMLMSGTRYIGLVVLSSVGEEIQWPDIANDAWSKRTPDSSSLDYLIYLCEKPLADNLEQRASGFPRCLRVLSREAFAQLCALAVDDPDAKDVEPPGEGEAERRIPAVWRARTFLTSEFLETRKSTFFRTAEDIDRELKQDADKSRINISRVALIGGLSVKKQNEEAVRQPIDLLHHQLNRINEKLEELIGNEETADVGERLQEAWVLLPKEPSRCVAVCIDVLKDLMDEVYEWKEQTVVPDTYACGDLVRRLLASGTLPPNVAALTGFERYGGPQSSPDRAARIEVDGKVMWLPSGITADKAVAVLENLVDISEWFIEWSGNVERNLFEDLSEPLVGVLRAAFEQDSLERMLWFKLSRTLFEIVPHGDFETVTFRLVKRAYVEGWIPDLIEAAYETNPGNPRWKAFRQKFWKLLEKWGIHEVTVDISESIERM